MIQEFAQELGGLATRDLIPQINAIVEELQAPGASTQGHKSDEEPPLRGTPPQGWRTHLGPDVDRLRERLDDVGLVVVEAGLWPVDPVRQLEGWWIRGSTLQVGYAHRSHALLQPHQRDDPFAATWMHSDGEPITAVLLGHSNLLSAERGGRAQDPTGPGVFIPVAPVCDYDDFPSAWLKAAAVRPISFPAARNFVLLAHHRSDHGWVHLATPDDPFNAKVVEVVREVSGELSRMSRDHGLRVLNKIVEELQ